MNKFTKLITEGADKTLQRRAETVSTAAEIAQQNLVNKLKLEKSNLELKITNLTDFAPDSKDSLRPCDANWDPNAWVTNLQRAKQDLYNVTIQLEIAQKTYDEFFKEEAEMVTD
jgi:hypothetical protein